MAGRASSVIGAWLSAGIPNATAATTVLGVGEVGGRDQQEVPKRINAMMKKVVLDHRRNRTDGTIL
jgi:hypothetical protein